MIEAYPLCWPPEYPRSKTMKYSRFKTTPGQALYYVKSEIKRIVGTNPVISTDVPLKKDGDLRADLTHTLNDHGVAVYFTRNNQQVCLCCDSYVKVWDNLYAVGRTIEALRQIDRDGVSDFLNRTFTGFKAIEERSSFNQKSIWEILGLDSDPASEEVIELAYKQKAKRLHIRICGLQALRMHFMN